MTALRGAITALVTPFRPDGTVDETAFASLVEWQIAEGIDGIVPVGSTGEAVTLSLIDISLFTTMHTIGTGNAGPSVTIELSTQFVGGGDPKRPLDAVCEIVRETGSLVFVRGEVVQESDAVASFSGIVRKMKPRPSA